MQNDKPEHHPTLAPNMHCKKNNRTPLVPGSAWGSHLSKKLRFAKRQTGTSPNIGSKHALQKNKPKHPPRSRLRRRTLLSQAPLYKTIKPEHHPTIGSKHALQKINRFQSLKHALFKMKNRFQSLKHALFKMKNRFQRFKHALQEKINRFQRFKHALIKLKTDFKALNTHCSK
ncbi:MAG: hypothetical protein R3C26_11590 [Calditrichia bacterium]